MITYTWKVCFNWRQVHDWLIILMGWHDAHNQSEDNSQKNPKEIKSFMMNQATPHLGALSSLINSESSNRRRQPEMGTALTFEWKASIRMSQYMGRAKKVLVSKQRHPMMMDHQRGGTYISHQVRMHACHLTSKHCTYLWFVTERSSMKSSKVVDKERIIELMMTKNRFRSWNEKRMRWTLPVGESQRNEDINPVIKESSSQPATRRCQVSQPCSGLLQPSLFAR